MLTFTESIFISIAVAVIIIVILCSIKFLVKEKEELNVSEPSFSDKIEFYKDLYQPEGQHIVNCEAYEDANCTVIKYDWMVDPYNLDTYDK